MPIRSPGLLVVPGEVASPGTGKVALELARIPSNMRHAAESAFNSEAGLSGAMKISIVTFDDFTDLDLFILWGLLKRVESLAEAEQKEKVLRSSAPLDAVEVSL